MIYQVGANLEMIWESQTSINALWTRRYPTLSSDEIVPVDAEGMMKDGKFVHFNRESLVIDPRDIANLRFGEVLPNPVVYKTRIEGGVPIAFKPEYVEPFLGPDGIQVKHPHVWGPEDLICRELDALDVPGYAGRWMEIERDKERKIRDGQSLLPDDVLAKPAA